MSARAKCPGRRGPILKMRSHCFRQYGFVFVLVLSCLLPRLAQAFTLIDPQDTAGAAVQSITLRTYMMNGQLFRPSSDVFGNSAEVSVSSILGLEPSALVGSVTIARETFLVPSGFTIEIAPPSQYIFIQN